MDTHFPMCRFLLSALALIAAASVGAEMIGPKQVPVERILKNAVANVRAHPENPDAHYALGRIRYAAYCSTDPRAIRMYKETPPYGFPTDHPSSWEFSNSKPKDDPATVKLIGDAIFNLRNAIRLDKGREPGLYHLTLACAFEASAPIAAKIDPRATREGWMREALRQYRLAFVAASGGDEKRPYAARPMTYERWISVEAGESALRLNPKTPDAASIRAHLAKIAKLPNGPITPIVFSLDSSRLLEDLLDGAKTVDFDLDGTGLPQRWSWTKPDTAILVWQPDPSVPVTSGRQLFGSATWWMMYQDGYAALAALDNDRNGWLEGKELFGLAVWRDGNGDGRADAGEVVPVRALGIEGLATAATGRTGRSLVSRDGLRLRDGRTLPTYDWVVAPVERRR